MIRDQLQASLPRVELDAKFDRVRPPSIHQVFTFPTWVANKVAMNVECIDWHRRELKRPTASTDRETRVNDRLSRR
ncbi:hypothetical protein CEE69_28000 [Rhodopirellula bahusiensis]|uniref:Uncharacterized protein n=1 Tax=Rhodopirellula bahusiensis TaxID=2014065 RepID=A0A2G1VZ12_9BACT|nr:hypothetical protein CEE69_28000 [Rhodopirellula bahusiensis]